MVGKDLLPALSYNRSGGSREDFMHGSSLNRFNSKDDDRGANWEYVLTVVYAFGTFVMLVTVGMMAWILGII
jgi:hypothetical protein